MPPDERRWRYSATYEALLADLVARGWVERQSRDIVWVGKR